MLDFIKFQIYKRELIEALEFLSPFIVEKEDEIEMICPQPYFYDKVTFLLYKNHACLSVITKEGAWIERTCEIESNVEEVAFCIPLASLLQQVYNCYVERFIFIEDRFFGFDVGESDSDNYLFAIEAYSASKHPSIHPKFHHKGYIQIDGFEFNTLIKVLKEFPKYTTDCGLRPYTEYIWFFINNGTCRVVAYSDWQLRQELFPTKVIGSYEFSLPGKFASRVLDNIVDNQDYYSCDKIGYFKSILCFYRNDNNTEHYDEIIELPMCKTKLPSIQDPLKRMKISFRSFLHLKDVQSALRMINAMDYKEDYVLMHFFPDHVNIYHGDTTSEKKFFFFIDADGNGEHIFKLNKKKLGAILEELNTDIISFSLVGDDLLYFNNNDEALAGRIVRILWTAMLQDEDLKLLDRGDKYLNTHEGYIEKYLNKHNDEGDSPKKEYATTEEMKAEALFRMNEVIDDSDIIDYFEETGKPQIYSPPYGECLSLEDGELDNVRNVENTHQVFVWGVIRYKMRYNWRDVTVDCMLHVSKDKDL